jgi:glycosyltransferase involved in cell wall biosynthesis
MKTVTLVIPIYNESGAIENNLPAIIEAVAAIEHFAFEIVLVDDGSSDGCATWLKRFCQEREHLELLCLSRNFGKEAAILAGLVHARGDAVIVMDSDLQHPPALIPRMLALWEQGMDVVEACKASRGRESLSAKLLAGGFYRLFNLLAGMNIENYSDFKLLDRKVVDAYCALPERKRFFRGLIAWMGSSSARVFFDVPERQHGASAWSKLKLFRFSLTALTSFSSIPLHLITLLGLFCFSVSLILGGIALYDKYTGEAVSGFTTVILLILLIGSLLMVGLGLIGIYLEQIFEEIKQRPIYMVDRRRSHLKEPS